MHSLLDWDSEYNGLEIQFLSLLEKLDILNRWLKTDYAFYYQDKDALYSIQHRIIRDFLRDGTLTIKQILKRNNPVLEKIKTLDPASIYSLECSWSNRLPVWFLRFKRAFENGIQWALPPEEYQQRFSDYRQNMTAYNAIQMQNQQKYKQFSLLLSQWSERRNQELADWSKKNNIEIPQTNKGQICKDHKYQKWLQSIEAKGFFYSDIPKPEAPIQDKCDQPVCPKKSYTVPLNEYELGTIPKIDEILSAAQPFFDKPCQHLTQREMRAYEEQLLTQDCQQFLQEFAVLIEQDDCTPEEVYAKLCSLEEMNWSDYGLRKIYEGSETNEEFTKWHQINFDPKGMWLIEFIALRGQTFHLPYRMALEIGIIDHDSILHQGSPFIEFKKMGSPLPRKEQQLFPLIPLLKSLGCSKDDFPHHLNEYPQYQSIDSERLEDFLQFNS